MLEKFIPQVKWTQEEIFHNDKAHVFLFRIKSNTLGLNDRNRDKGGCIKCELCGTDLEVLIHFVAECHKFQNKRNTILRLQNPQEEIKTKLVGEIIFESNGNLGTPHKIWILRAGKIAPAVEF